VTDGPFDDLVILRNTTFYDHVTELEGVWEGEELYQAKPFSLSLHLNTAVAQGPSELFVGQVRVNPALSPKQVDYFVETYDGVTYDLWSYGNLPTQRQRVDHRIGYPGSAIRPTSFSEVAGVRVFRLYRVTGPTRGTVSITTTYSKPHSHVRPLGQSHGRRHILGQQQHDSGQYTVTFNNITGYETPAEQSATLDEGGTLEVSGAYVHYGMGSLSVSTTPVAGEIIVDAVSKERGLGAARCRPGTMSSVFGSVSGYLTPADQIVAVPDGSSRSCTASTWPPRNTGPSASARTLPQHRSRSQALRPSGARDFLD